LIQIDDEIATVWDPLIRIDDDIASQAAILRPVTERRLRSLKISPGMRILDLGCGASDVFMLAAEFVGPTGLVVGSDSNSET